MQKLMGDEGGGGGGGGPCFFSATDPKCLCLHSEWLNCIEFLLSVYNMVKAFFKKNVCLLSPD